jgi:hypothetical protein
MKAWWLLRSLKFIAITSLLILVFGMIVTGLWNDLIPELFHGPVLTFWQGIGLLILAHIFFRGALGFGRGHRWGGGGWHRKFEEKLAAMTPEEREKFRAEYRRRCGTWSHDDTPETHDSASGQKA